MTAAHSSVVAFWNFLFGLSIIPYFGLSSGMQIVLSGTLACLVGTWEEARAVEMHLQLQAKDKLLTHVVSGFCTISTINFHILEVSPQMRELFHGTDLLGVNFESLIHYAPRNYHELLQAPGDQLEPILVTFVLPGRMQVFDCKILPYCTRGHKLSISFSVVGEIRLLPEQPARTCFIDISGEEQQELESWHSSQQTGFASIVDHIAHGRTKFPCWKDRCRSSRMGLPNW
eukprot:gnl/MRDRNA2_/MRDRNA2_86767_c0_seq12.p1 gnl/MRDRNA2_/MRDRNA2_86767_c0~~gnl/MRDRNA2_/MRDRNA2_86767_c0_seq12.p1  ORF type:complete len:244 (-),score=27.02 gnl/MRDRNA2_/MRDRNA2_86767_c0_seq12:4-693(-)